MIQLAAETYIGSHCFRVFQRMAATHKHEAYNGAAQITTVGSWNSE